MQTGQTIQSLHLLEHGLHNVRVSGRARGIKSLVFKSPMFSASDWKKDANKLIAKLPPKNRKLINIYHEIGATDSKVYEHAMMSFYFKHVLRDKKKLEALMKNFASGHGNGKKIPYGRSSGIVLYVLDFMLWIFSTDDHSDPTTIATLCPSPHYWLFDMRVHGRHILAALLSLI